MDWSPRSRTSNPGSRSPAIVTPGFVPYGFDGQSGLISAWSHDGRFILTWEECPDGDQFDEHAYTRDERHEFASAEEVLAFVEGNGHPASAFGP